MIGAQAVHRVDHLLGEVIRQRRRVRVRVVRLEARDLILDTHLTFAHVPDVLLGDSVLRFELFDTLIAQPLDVGDARVRIDEHAVVLFATLPFLARLGLGRFAFDPLGARRIALDDAQRHAAFVEHFGVEPRAGLGHAVAVMRLAVLVLATVERVSR